jgi:iron complex transport system ATP-binding protein
MVAAVIDLQGIECWREDRLILKDLDWTVRAGEHWAVIGENGAGKTTLLNVVNGYLWPRVGAVEVLGGRYGQVDLPEHRKRIGWVTSSLGTHLASVRPDETALEVVVSGRYARIGQWDLPTADDRDSAREILAAFRATELAERPFRTLSQGEQQTILIARAWMTSAELLILDEPCIGLDLRAREGVLSAVQHLGERADAPTLLYVTHHAEEILPLFTHVLLIKAGRAVAAGPKAEVLTSNRLSHLFGVSVDVHWQSGRPWVAVVEGPAEATAKPSGQGA